MATVLFYILGFTMLAATLLCITRRNPVHAVIYLVAGLFALALMFYLLGAPLVAAWQVIVYAGAIMVLFLFVVMLLGAEQLQGASQGSPWQWFVSILLGAALVVTFVRILTFDVNTAGSVSETAVDAGPASIGLELFEAYVFPFEVASIVLLVAMVGVVVLRSRKGKDV